MSEYIVKCKEFVGISGAMMLFPEYIDMNQEIVRCKDCKYSIHFLHHDDERWQCDEPHQEGDDVKPDAYCWRGERKEVGE